MVRPRDGKDLANLAVPDELCKIGEKGRCGLEGKKEVLAKTPGVNLGKLATKFYTVREAEAKAAKLLFDNNLGKIKI